MENNILKLFILLMIAMYCNSCEFEPSAVNYKHIDDNIEPFQIDFELAPEGDTIYVYKSADLIINYNAENYNKKFIEAVVYKDSSRYTSSQKIGKSLKVSWNRYQKHDTMNITFAIYFHSGTGSLADQLVAETFFIEKKWVLIFYDENTLFDKKLTFDKSKGDMRISWNQIGERDFKSYSLYKLTNNGYSSSLIGQVFNYEPKSTLIDSNYVGQESFYVVIFYDKFGKYIKYEKQRVEKDKLDFSYHLNGNELSFKWTKSKYYNNFERYFIGRGHYFGDSYRVLDTNDLNVTQYNIDYFYPGSKTDFVLTTFAKVENPIYGFRRDTLLNVQNGDDFMKFDRYSHSTNELALLQVEDEISVVNLNSPEVLNTFKGNDDKFKISLNNKYAIGVKNVLNFINLENPSIVKSFTVDEITNGGCSSFDYTYEPDVSNQGILVTRSAPICGSSVYFYDLINEKFLFEHSKTGKYGMKKTLFSKNGDYIFASVDGMWKIYKFNESELVRITNASIQDINSRILLNPYDNNQFVYTGNTGFSIYQINPFKNIKSISDKNFLVQIDFKKGLYYSREIIDLNNGVVIYNSNLQEKNLETGEILREKLINNYKYFYFDDNIYHENGLTFNF